MAILSISEAARKAGVARSTIQRKLKEGSLSAIRRPDGTRGIETSELYRVFGEPQGRQQDASAVQPETEHQERALLQSQLEAMRQELDAARDREGWYRARIENLEQRLLPPPRQSWLDRLAEAINKVRGR